ncbi:MAG: YfiR family protein [Salinivirgaceae bacterium]|nr:YfiR family protein [Salinivirgaceae bacterium]
MTKKTKYIIIILAIFFASIKANCQSNREQIILAYLNNFVKYTNWPNESIKDSFQIAILSQNKKQIAEFRNFSKNRTLKDKPIGIKVINEKSVLSNFQLIFISQNNRSLLPEIYGKIDGKAILLVSENYSDKRFVMINLYDTGDKALQFEINKANIFSQNLEIDPEVLLAGGTEIDVIKLYRSSQFNLLKMKAEMDVIQDSMQKLTSEASSTLVQINRQKDEILKQNDRLLKRSTELDSLRDVLAVNNAVLKFNSSLNFKRQFCHNPIVL